VAAFTRGSYGWVNIGAPLLVVVSNFFGPYGRGAGAQQRQVELAR
jgi:hypothetical protein